MRVPVARALISVFDKTGLIPFAQFLANSGIEIISTGGTATEMRAEGIEVREVSSVTGFPEMMDGRLKTIHPLIAGGLLAIRDNPTHLKAMEDHGIEPIDLLVVNLYPFEKTVARTDATIEEIIENIDIGGPNMIRAGLKNFRSVAVVTNPTMYSDIQEEMEENEGQLSLSTRKYLFVNGFDLTAKYDTAVAKFGREELHVNDNDEPYRSSPLNFI